MLIIRFFSSHVAEIKDGVQAVDAALSGLIGSIVGYYFGESAAKSRSPIESSTPPPAVEQPLSAQTESGISIPAKPTITGTTNQ